MANQTPEQKAHKLSTVEEPSDALVAKVKEMLATCDAIGGLV